MFNDERDAEYIRAAERSPRVVIEKNHIRSSATYSKTSVLDDAVTG